MTTFKSKPFVYDDAAALRFSKQIINRLKPLVGAIVEIVKREYGIIFDGKDEDKKKDLFILTSIKKEKQRFDEKNKAAFEKMAKEQVRGLSLFSQSAFLRMIAEMESVAKKEKISFDSKKMKSRLGSGLLAEQKIKEVSNRITSLSDVVVDRISKEIGSFKRFGDVNRLLRIVNASGEVGLNRARFIAEQTTRNVLSEFNTARATSTGGREFEWLHSGAGLVPRPLHVSYDNRIFRFDKPPHLGDGGGRGMPGRLPNCRCFFATVYKFEDLA